MAPFPELWRRRSTFSFEDERLEVLALPDLVAAKKTQHDKDWPMIRRLVDVNYLGHRHEPTPEQVRFWLLELRTPELLVEAVQACSGEADLLAAQRPLLKLAREQYLEDGGLRLALREEEERVRREDAEYWKPLKRKVEELRLSRQRRSDT